MSQEQELITKLSIADDVLVIKWQDGKESRLYSHWMRDHCQMPTSIDADNGQRLLVSSIYPKKPTSKKPIRMKKAMSACTSSQKTICLFFLRAG